MNGTQVWSSLSFSSPTRERCRSRVSYDPLTVKCFVEKFRESLHALKIEMEVRVGGSEGNVEKGWYLPNSPLSISSTC